MKGVGIAVFVLGVLAMAQQSMQFSFKNPNLISQKLKSDDEPYIALVFTSNATEKALIESGFFTPGPYVDSFGRRFKTGTIYGYPVVYVISASTPSVHVGVTVQILCDNFDVGLVISVGTAGSTNERIEVGSVVIPRVIAFTGNWDWLEMNSLEKGQLNFGDFNLPAPGKNLLGSIAFEDMQIYNHGQIYRRFWLPINRLFLFIASHIVIPEVDVIVGLNSSSSDIYVNNSAYGDFLHNTFNISTVDIASVAVGLAAYSHDQNFIAFQGISNSAGAGSGESKSALANENVVKAVVRFTQLVTGSRVPHEY